jgi:hypothetical protein
MRKMNPAYARFFMFQYEPPMLVLRQTALELRLNTPELVLVGLCGILLARPLREPARGVNWSESYPRPWIRGLKLLKCFKTFQNVLQLFKTVMFPAVSNRPIHVLPRPLEEMITKTPSLSLQLGVVRVAHFRMNLVMQDVLAPDQCA